MWVLIDARVWVISNGWLSGVVVRPASAARLDQVPSGGAGGDVPSLSCRR